jgi:hypothetical protein
MQKKYKHSEEAIDRCLAYIELDELVKHLPGTEHAGWPETKTDVAASWTLPLTTQRVPASYG